MNFWSVRNVKNYYISTDPYLSNNKKCCPILHLNIRKVYLKAHVNSSLRVGHVKIRDDKEW